MRLPTRRLAPALPLIFAACVLALAPAPAARADDDRAAKLAAEKAKWVQEYESLLARHSQLRAELDAALASYSRGRNSLQPRGEGKAGLIAEMERLEKDFAEVDQELKDFPEKARRAGAFPGWFRDVAPAAQAAPAAAQSGAANDDDAGRSSLSDRRAKSRERRKLD